MASEGQKFVGKGGQKCPHANVKSPANNYTKKSIKKEKEKQFLVQGSVYLRIRV